MLIKLNEAKGRLADRGKRLSLNDISRLTGINQTTLDNISTGKTKELRVEYVDALCAVLETTPGELFEAEPIALPLALNIRPDRHGKRVGEASSVLAGA